MLAPRPAAQLAAPRFNGVDTGSVVSLHQKGELMVQLDNTN